MEWLRPTRLEGESVTLEPLAQSHAAGLAEAVRDGELWRLWYTTIPAPDAMAAEIERRLGLQRAGSMLPFAIIENSSGAPVGMTTCMNADAVNRRLEIGSTWLTRRLQRTAANSECKLALLTHGFETLDCIAIELRTHIMNEQSRRAIERLGAKLDGILRSHQILGNGSIRDTCVYSIVASEWPMVKENLKARMGKSSFL